MFFTTLTHIFAIYSVFITLCTHEIKFKYNERDREWVWKLDVLSFFIDFLLMWTIFIAIKRNDGKNEYTFDVQTSSKRFKSRKTLSKLIFNIKYWFDRLRLIEPQNTSLQTIRCVFPLYKWSTPKLAFQIESD